MSDTLPEWDTFRQDYPDAPEDQLRAIYVQAQRQHGAQQRFSGRETWTGFLGRRAIPFESVITNVAERTGAADAQQRISEGRGHETDFNLMAHQQQEQQFDADRGLGGKILSGVAHVPAFVGEAAVGGTVLSGLAGAAPRALGWLAPRAATSGIQALVFPAAPLLSGAGLRGLAASSPAWAARTAAMTAMMPSMWLERASQNAEESGGSTFNVDNLVPALGLGFLQVGVLWMVGKVGHAAAEVVAGLTGKTLTGWGIRAATGLTAGTATGMAGQQVVDTVSSGIADQLGDVWKPLKKMDTGYGILGNFLKGEHGQAWEHTAVQAATFAVFSMLHGVPEARPKSPFSEPTLQRFREAGQFLKRNGMSEQAAGERMQEIYDRITNKLNEDPFLTREKARELYNDLPPSPLRLLGESLADTLPPEVSIPKEAIQQQAQQAPQTGEMPVPEAAKSTQPVVAEVPVESAKLAVENPGVLDRTPGRFAPEMEAQIEKTAREVVNHVDPEGQIERIKETVKDQATQKAILDRIEQLRTEQSSGVLPRTPEVQTAPIAPEPVQPIPQMPTAETPGVLLRTPEPVPVENRLADLEAKVKSQGYKTSRIRTLIEDADSREEAEAQIAKWKGPRAEYAKAYMEHIFSEPPAFESLLEAIKSGVKEAETYNLKSENGEPLKLVEPARLIYHLRGEQGVMEWLDAMKELRQPGVMEQLTDAEKALLENTLPRTKPIEVSKDVEAESNRTIAEIEREIQQDAARGGSAEALESSPNAGEGGQNQSIPAEPANATASTGLNAGTGAKPTSTTVDKSAVKPPPAPDMKNLDPFKLGPTKGAPETEVASDWKPVEAASKPTFEAQSAKDFVFMQSGPNPGNIGTLTQAPAAQLPMMEKFKRAVAAVWHSGQELAGRMFPKTGALDQKSGEMIAQHAASDIYVDRAIPYFIDSVMGPLKSVAERVLYGTALSEARHRYAKASFLAEANRLYQQYQTMPQGAARDAVEAQMNELVQKSVRVSTFIGMDNSPLRSEADYQKTINSPEMQGLIQRYKSIFVDVMEGFHKMARDIDPANQIQSRTQMKDLPINAKPVMANDLPTKGGIKTSNFGKGLRAPAARSLVFAREFGGDAEAYDTDLGNIMANTLRRSVPLATKAQMYRALEEAGLGKWAKPGEKVEINGEQAKLLKEVNPPKGTQAADVTETNFHVDARVFNDVMKALDTQLPLEQRGPIFKGVRRFNDVLTKISLMSFVEAATHSKNLATFAFKPGVSPVDMASNFYKVAVSNAKWMQSMHDFVTQSPGAGEAMKLDVMKRSAELARIGAMKSPGLESDQGNWMNTLTGAHLFKATGKFIDIIDTAQRLTAEDAFNRLERGGVWTPLGEFNVGSRVQNTESNKRDFINQLGQYNKRAQNELVVLLRESGIGPFATAGTNYTIQGLRALTLNPGVKATGLGQATGLRLEMGVRLAAVLSLAPLLNYMMWGRADGDENTSLGSIKTGVDRQTGETSYFDLAAMTGLTRGARLVGLQALLEGRRPDAGATGQQIAYHAAVGAYHSVAHPFYGPGVTALHTAALGSNNMGHNVARPAERPRTGDQIGMNFLAAMWNMNPSLAAFSGAAKPSKEKTSPLESFGFPASEMPYNQRAQTFLGPFGQRYRERPPGYSR